MFKYLVLLFSLNITQVAICSDANGESQKKSSFQFFKDKQTKIKNPFELRDPFRRNLPKRSRRKVSYGQMKDGGLFSNIETIEGVPIEQIKVVGVLLGPNRRAMVKIVKVDNVDETHSAEVKTQIKGDDRTFVIKEGMKLGIDGAEVKAILPGGIVLVERIRNVYDQDEYLETIIPVSE